MRLAALLLASCAAMAAPASAAPATYRLDPDATFATFEVLHFGTSTLRGHFGPTAGFVRMDAAAASGELGLEIATANVHTGLPAFDARLRRPDLLAVDAWPSAWFVARRWRFDDAGHPVELRGEFTLRGVSQPLSLVADRFACHADEARGGREVCGGDFHGEFHRSEFGMTFGLPFVADTVRLRVSVQGVRE